MGVKGSAQTYAYATVGLVGIVALVSVFIILRSNDFSLGGSETNTFGSAVAANPTVIIYNGEEYPLLSATPGDTFFHGSANAQLVSLPSGTAQVRLWSPTQSAFEVTLRRGDTYTFADVTITLYAVEGATAQFVVAAAANSCAGSRDEQTPLCRGENGCCSGVCTRLPDCFEQVDGPVFTCGARQMYCCDGKLSGIACNNGDEYPSLEIFQDSFIDVFLVVNGVTFPRCGEIDLDWCVEENPTKGTGPFEFSWGDGTKSCSWFPGNHTYSHASQRTVSVRVRNTCGFIAERSLQVTPSSCGNAVCEPGEATVCPPFGDGPCYEGTCPQDCEDPIECTTTAQCPVITCVTEPCPQNVCINGKCVEQLPPQGKECSKDTDCPVITCVTEPCLQDVCENGVCVPRSGGALA